MPDSMKVLSVGSTELTNLVQDTLLLHRRSRLSVAASYWELCSLSLRQTEQISIAIVDLSVSASEVRQRTEHIRRRWPEAEILLVGDNADHLEDPLYDERVPLGVQPRELLTVLERLVAEKVGRDRTKERPQ